MMNVKRSSAKPAKRHALASTATGSNSYPVTMATASIEAANRYMLSWPDAQHHGLFEDPIRVGMQEMEYWG